MFDVVGRFICGPCGRCTPNRSPCTPDAGPFRPSGVHPPQPMTQRQREMTRLSSPRAERRSHGFSTRRRPRARPGRAWSLLAQLLGLLLHPLGVLRLVGRCRRSGLLGTKMVCGRLGIDRNPALGQQWRRADGGQHLVGRGRVHRSLWCAQTCPRDRRRRTLVTHHRDDRLADAERGQDLLEGTAGLDDRGDPAVRGRGGRNDNSSGNRCVLLGLRGRLTRLRRLVRQLICPLLRSLRLRQSPSVCCGLGCLVSCGRHCRRSKLMVACLTLRLGVIARRHGARLPPGLLAASNLLSTLTR